MSNKFKYKYQIYKHLQANTANIYAEARKIGEGNRNYTRIEK